MTDVAASEPNIAIDASPEDGDSEQIFKNGNAEDLRNVMLI